MCLFTCAFEDRFTLSVCLQDDLCVNSKLVFGQDWDAGTQPSDFSC